ncbi:MAG TPA: MFS transporter [Victivallales bacterium]|nr:MFS transporter [Victivallales bacterium]
MTPDAEILLSISRQRLFTKFNWQANYKFMALLSFAIGIITLFFYGNIRQKTNNKRSIKDYKSFILDKYFMVLVLLCLLGCASISIQVTEMPFINDKIFNLTPIYSGTVLMALSIMFLLGNILNYYLLKFIEIKKLISITITVFFLASLVMIYSIHNSNILYSVIPFMLILFVTGLLFPNLMTLAMCYKKENAGIAGGFIGFAMYIGGAMITAILGFFPMNNKTLSLSLIITIILVIFFWKKGKVLLNEL